MVAPGPTVAPTTAREPIAPELRAREAAMVRVILLDFMLILIYVLTAVLSGSLTILAVLLRGVLASKECTPSVR